MKTKIRFLEIYLILLVLLSCSCSRKNTDWEFAGSRRVNFEVLRPNHNELFFQGQKFSDTYYIDVDIYTRYIDGKKQYGVKNDEGNVYPDDHAGFETLNNELYIGSFRYSGIIGRLSIEYQLLP